MRNFKHNISKAFSETTDKLHHESAIKHVTGAAKYVDDITETNNTLHVATGFADIVCGEIVSIDLSQVRNAEGVVDVITADDIPGDPDIAPVYDGDFLLSAKRVEFHGQAIFAVAATSLRAAKKAVLMASIECIAENPILTPQQSLQKQSLLLPSNIFGTDKAVQAIEQAASKIEGRFYLKGQEHFYLEGQISLAIPNEDGGVHIYSSSQHPAEIQKLAASVLDIPINKVNAEVVRMGGGFGGKESQAAMLACIAAIFATRTNQAVKYRMPRQDDFLQTGKRHDFWNQYSVGFDDEGLIQGVIMELAGKCGHSTDLSEGVIDRAMFHADNAYYYQDAKIVGHYCRTNTVSNTAFRGFGGPQGVITAEIMIEDIARSVGKDPLDIRKLNCYQADRNITPYGQTIEQEVLPDLIEHLEATSSYRERRQAITLFNTQNSLTKKGLALTPVKFGISFTSKHLNQAGALVHVYTDGSIHLNHGGTEMGQGLYTKVAQIVARGFGVNIDRVAISSTRTDKVPNSSPTAASAGTDLNGMAALDAVSKIKRNLYKFVASHFDVSIDEVAIIDDHFCIAGKKNSFEDIIKLAYMNRVPLSSTGFYKTPKIGYDKKSKVGRPFLYYANGAAVSEVIIDVMTGEYNVTRTDIVHDVGNSINPDIDIGQIKGAFIQGMGWLTTEELSWQNQGEKSGQLISNCPANYKIPTAVDTPDIFNVSLYPQANNEETPYHSKAVGEPPLMLGISVWCALRDACASIADYKISPNLEIPATPENVYKTIQSLTANEYY
ncbi:MAG: xanthine dehydrogenase molybdopterin binding subunit [Acidiferrobacterales bacterium]|nr:xanthine dehydrogenase molybdopterin binding subunit [Acidiferrobacterales bacterium]